ncbi:MAG: hypothetical protein WC370_01430 [Dehalococcoidales bacterium]
MARKTSLTVNNVPIVLDYFVEGYVYHVTGGIIASLKDTGPIKNLTLTAAGDGQMSLTLNGADVPLNEFVVKIVRSTLAGMVATLKGVDSEMKTLELKISA